MKNQGNNPPQPNPLPANMDQSELASNQNAEPVKWFAGTRLIAVHWVSPIYNLTSKGGGVTKK